MWRGSRSGGVFTVLSPNFDTLGSGTCSGDEVNQVRALAVGGPADSNGSSVIYATTTGLGPLDGPLNIPAGGRVWVTTNASAGVSAFADVTNNGPHGNINPNQFPASSVAIDPSDPTGKTAYVTVMGFTGGSGHVWKTTNAGGAWNDFTGNLPDSPVNAVVVYAALSQVYVATDVGVFSSSTSGANWSELGPVPSATSSGFLPNVAVTALGIFASGGQQLLRASTYGRGMWEFDLASKPDFQISVTNSPLTISAGATATFNGTVAALDGFSGTVTLSCTAGITSPPSICSSPQSPLTPGVSTSFAVTAGGAAGDYYFNVQGVGSDSSHTSHLTGAELHILSGAADFALSDAQSYPTVNAGSSTTSGPISVSGSNGFTGTISLTCSLVSGTGSCSVNPATVTSIPTAISVIVNATTLSAGGYQLVVQGTSGAITHTLRISFNVGDFQLTGAQPLTLGPGTQGTANLTVTASTYYSGNIIATCAVNSLPGSTCSLTPVSPVVIGAGSTVPLIATVNVPSNAACGAYSISVNVHDVGGTPSHALAISLTVQDFVLNTSTASQTVVAGASTSAYSLTLQPVTTSFNSPITVSCSSGLPAGAQCNFQPATAITPGSAPVAVAMTIRTSATTTAGTSTVTVIGTSGSLSRTRTVALTVTTPVGASNDFQLAAAQAFPTGIAAGVQAQAKVSVTGNYSGSVNAHCDASAISGQCLVMPANPVAISANAPAAVTIALNVPNTITPGTYNINLAVADSSGQPSHTLQLPLTVIPDFTVNAATPSQTLTAGQTTSGAYQLSVAPNPSGSTFPGAVTLSCPTGLPAGGQCLFNPSSPVTPGSTAQSVVMTISLAANNAGLYSRSERVSIFYTLCLLLPGIVIGWNAVGARSPKQGVGVSILLLLILSLLSCGGVSNSGSAPPLAGKQPVTYRIIVTGISSGTVADAGQSAVVTLIVD
jgi:uncharacterized membrane protein